MEFGFAAAVDEIGQQTALVIGGLVFVSIGVGFRFGAFVFVGWPVGGLVY
jgi:hypothetical protein